MSALADLFQPAPRLRRSIVDSETGNVVPSQPRLSVGEIAGAYLDLVGSRVRDAVTAPRDAYRGDLQVFDPATGHPSAEAMERAAGGAGLALTGSLPFTAPAGALRTFGGRAARTADTAALARAETMRAEGAAPDAIWSETGWTFGRDGAPRFEIPDDAAQVRPHDGASATTLGQALDHPRLYEAYPELQGVSVYHRPELGAEAAANPGKGYVALDLNDPQALASLLHEGQHFVQRREGFAPGANPNDATVSALPQVAEVTALREQARAAGSARAEPLLDQADARARMEAYRTSAGEVEARNVEARQSMTPAERRATPPTATEDVPTGRQWVPGALGAGAAVAAVAAPGAAQAEEGVNGTRTISFEGRTITVPADTTDDEVAGILEASGPAPTPQAPLSGSDLDAMVRGQAPGAPAAPAPPAAESASSRVGDIVSGALGVVNQGVRGQARGLAGLAGLPVDLVTLGLNATGAPRALTGRDIERPFFGGEANKAAVDTVRNAPIAAARAAGADLSYPPNEPQNLAERVVGRIGEEMGAMALPAGAALGAAARLGREGAKRLPGIVGSMVESAAVSPGTFLGKEVAAAGAAGSGAAAANELTRAAGYKEGSLPQAAGDIAGAFGGLGLYGIASHIGPRIADVFNAVRGDPNFANQVAKDAAVDTIAEAYGLPSARLGTKEPTDVQPIIDAIERGRRVGDVVPGFQESLADRTGSSGLSGLEYSRQASGSPVFAERTRANTNAIDSAIQANAPAGAPGAFRGELEAQRTQRLQGVSSDAAAARARFDEAAGRLQSSMHADARGADIRAPLEDALAAAREVERGAWEGVSGAGRADIRPLVESFGGVTGRLSEAERQVFQPSELTSIPRRFLPAEEAAPTGNPALAGMSAEDRAIAERIIGPQAAPEPEPVRVALREATGLRSALTDAQPAAASAGETNRARVIGQYIDAVDGYLGTSMPGEAQAAYEAARGVSRDLNDRFTRPQTAIAQTLDRQQGQYRVPDSGVPRRFVQPDEGRVADFDALMREAGTDPRAQGAIRDQILADVQGLRGPDQIDAYVRSHSRVFERFPDLRRQVEETTGLRRSADAATVREREMTEQLGTPLQPGSSSVGRYLRYGDEASTTAMRGVINAPKPAEAMGELLNFAGNSPQAVEGAKRTFWDIMEGATRRRGETTGTVDGTQPWMPRALKRFLEEPRNRAVAERLYRDDPEHLRNVERIAEAIQGVDTRLRARAPNASGTAQGMSQVLSPETIQSRLYAYKRGQVSGTFLITSMAAVASRRSVRGAQSQAIGRLVDEALTNPDAAALLLRENNPATRAILARRAKGWIGNEAATLVEALDGEDEDLVKAAVRRAQ